MKNLITFLIILLSALNLYSQSDGRKAPNFSLVNLDGDIFELKTILGEGPILINFWATWCKPCIEELVQYKKIYEDYNENGFKVLAISTDTEKSVAKVKPLVKSKGYPFVILLDTNSEVARKFYVPTVPYSVILDKYGNIVYTHLGYMKGDELQVKKKLDELIKN